MTTLRQQILRQVRQHMHDNNVSAWIIPSADPHNSEYVSERYQRRSFVSGFTGSAGVAVITNKHALLWTDGRYFTQAQQQLSDEWSLMKDGLPNVLRMPEWLATTLNKDDIIGMDPYVTTMSLYKRINAACESKSIKVKFLDRNIVDDVWKEYDGPPNDDEKKNNELFIVKQVFAGYSVSEKLMYIRKQMKAKYLIVCALDEIAWCLNLRGSDVEYNPTFYSYMIIGQDICTMYVNEGKINNEVKQHLSDSNVRIRPYDCMVEDVSALNALVSLDYNVCNMAITQVLAKDMIINEQSPVCMAKAVKNDVECNGFLECHRRDAVAVIKYLIWLEKELKRPNHNVTESSAADYLESLRAQQDHYVSLSFETISSIGSNGAIIHYAPQPDTCARLNTNEMYLCDSGGQYFDGTTDITRTVHFGEPSAYEIECFTRVLKGHIALASVVFPEGTTGPTLDILARASLWNVGLDYGHGTGHGVGSFLNVHEGPHGISSTLRRGSVQTTPLVPMMTVTNEPGYYEVNKFGIRIENCMVVREAQTPHHFRKKHFFEFETVTVVPLQKKLINISLLNKQEIQWVNDYHALCWDSVSSLLKDDEEALEWLKDATSPLKL